MKIEADLLEQEAIDHASQRPVLFRCPECFGRGAWPLDPNCSTCAGTGVVCRQAFDSYLDSLQAQPMPDVPPLREWIVPIQAENERLRRLLVVNLATMMATVERLKFWGRSHSELDRAIDETKRALD